jgi:hypothetical protein
MTMSVSDRIEEWRRQLLDTSKRNRLISLNLGRAGALKLVHPSAERLWSILFAESGTMSFPLKQELRGAGIAWLDNHPSLVDGLGEGPLIAGEADDRGLRATPS